MMRQTVAAWFALLLVACSSGDGRPDSETVDSGDGLIIDADGNDVVSDGVPADETEPVPDPSVTGVFTWNRVDATVPVTVEGETEDIPITAWVPQGQEAFPLVVFNHGFSSEPAAYASYGEYLASWGFVVVMPKLPAGFFNPTPHRKLAEFLRGAVDWAVGPGNAADAPLAGKVDPESIGMAGHSLGGKLSFLLASDDDRIDAVFGVDPVDAGPPNGGDPVDWPSVAPELMGNIPVPFVSLGEKADGDLSDRLACAPADNRFDAYYAAAVGPAVMIEAVGADHVSFLDECDELCGAFCRAGTDNPAITRALVKRYLTAFFRQQLYGEPPYREWVAGSRAEPDVESGLVIIESKNGY